MSKKKTGFTMPIPKGFRKPKNPTRRQAERKEKLNKFLSEYADICKKHNLKLDAYFNYTPRGQVAILDVLFLELPQKYKDKPEKIQKDKKQIGKLVEPFLKEYEELKKKHKIEFHAICELNDNGIFPKLNMRDIPKQQFQVKDWDEAKKENEEIKKNEK